MTKPVTFDGVILVNGKYDAICPRCQDSGEECPICHGNGSSMGFAPIGGFPVDVLHREPDFDVKVGEDKTT